MLGNFNPDAFDAFDKAMKRSMSADRRRWPVRLRRAFRALRGI